MVCYYFSDVENDMQTGHHIVGRGGFPNNKGIVECDAAIMEGVPGRFGAVAALRGYISRQYINLFQTK